MCPIKLEPCSWQHILRYHAGVPCLPSSHAVLTVHRKNWEPLVLGPALAMLWWSAMGDNGYCAGGGCNVDTKPDTYLKIPGPVCLSWKLCARRWRCAYSKPAHTTDQQSPNNILFVGKLHAIDALTASTVAGSKVATLAPVIDVYHDVYMAARRSCINTTHTYMKSLITR